MPERQRFQSGGVQSPPSGTFRPGDNVRTQARIWNWRISTCNIIVEGTKDVGHFDLAAGLYHQKTGLRLIDDLLSIFPVGEGDKGGTKGMLRYFPVMRDVLEGDPVDHNGMDFKFVALLDSDPAGKGAARALTGRGMGFVMNRDIFLLQRVLPTETRDPTTFQRKCDDLNAKWVELDCEIEDLVSQTLLEEFRAQNGGYCKGSPMCANGAHHYEWLDHAKAPLLRFVNKHAILSDLEWTVGVLKSMRYMLGLPPEGTPVQSSASSGAGEGLGGIDCQNTSPTAQSGSVTEADPPPPRVQT